MFITDAAASPARSNMLHFEGTPLYPLSSLLRSGFPGSASGIGYPEKCFSLVPPNWDQSDASASGMTTSRPRVSLWLGTDAGPGPPTNDYLILGSHQKQTTGSTSMNQLDANPVFYERSPKNVQTYMTRMFCPSDYDGEKPLLSLNLPSGGSISDTHYSNRFTSSSSLQPGMIDTLGQGDQIMGVGMIGLEDLRGASNWIDRTSSIKRLSLLASVVLRSNPGARNVNGGETLSSVSSLYSQTHKHTPQMSAMTMLQKEAKMGTTVSNTSLLRGFGMAGLDTSSVNLGSTWKNSRSEHGKGITIIPNMVQPHQFIREPLDLPSASLEFGNAVDTNDFTQPKNVIDNTTLHEIMNYE